MGGAPRQRATLLLDLWVLVLAVVLCLPALTHAGLGLSGDLVFSPRQPLTPDTLGLGGRLPRATPLDAVTALLGYAVPGAVLFRVAVLAGLVLAGTGAHRLVRDASPVPRAAAAALAVWNPYVAERLALGQWALLIAYGALFHVAGAAVRARREGELPWGAWAWVGLASLTPTGGLLATVTAVVLGATGRVRTVVLLGGCLLLQLPWVLPSLLGAGTGGSDPAGLLAFRAGPDVPGGTLPSLLGGGGIWDLDSVPTSRGSLLGLAAAVVVVLVVVVAARHLPPGTGRLVPLAVAGLVLALAPRVPGLDAVVRGVVAHVPGGGLLRDSQKWVAPLLLLASVSLAVALDRARAWAGRRDAGVGLSAVVVGLLLPFVLLPDATTVTWDAVRPVTYPGDFARVRAALDRDDAAGAMVLLPLRSYRAFDWGNRRTAYDPAFAWFDVPLVASDALRVGRRTVSDADPAVDRVRAALRASEPVRPLASLGIRWALVYTDDPQTPGLRLDGLRPVVEGTDLRLYRVDGPVADRAAAGDVERVVVVGADLLVLLFWGLSCGAAARGPRTGSLRAIRQRRRRRG